LGPGLESACVGVGELGEGLVFGSGHGYCAAA
jgi:hypothetical protein